jgi:hypothetical protein
MFVYHLFQPRAVLFVAVGYGVVEGVNLLARNNLFIFDSILDGFLGVAACKQ